jgi:PAS domain S-box-containing protein
MNSHSINTTRGNILLVDDTPNNLRLLSAMLMEQGYNVRRVVNGHMALKTAQANPPDLVLLDIKMPDMNGYEVCQHLKTTAATQDVPVIFISALDEVLDKVKAFAVGGVDYITKPFSEEEVFVRVENSLTLRKLQKQLQQQNQRLIQETTRRQQLEEQLAISTARNQVWLDHAIVGIFRLSLEGQVLAANQHLAALLGYASVAEMESHLDLLTHTLDRSQAQILADLQARSPRRYQIQVSRPDGSLVWGVLCLGLNRDANWIDGAIVDLVDLNEPIAPTL